MLTAYTNLEVPVNGTPLINACLNKNAYTILIQGAERVIL
jgi:hypothetical protein